MLVADAVANLEFNGCGVEIVGVADTIQARNARYHNHITASRQQSRGGAETHLLDLVVYREILFNICVCSGKVCLGLIIIVI